MRSWSKCEDMSVQSRCSRVHWETSVKPLTVSLLVNPLFVFHLKEASLCQLFHKLNHVAASLCLNVKVQCLVSYQRSDLGPGQAAAGGVVACRRCVFLALIGSLRKTAEQV